MQSNIKLFSNESLELKVRTILNADGSISVSAEDAAIGYGFTTVAKSGNVVVRWNRVNQYLKELGFTQKVEKDDFIPESLFYMLGMKANNDKARQFQKWLAMEVLPSIRKTGKYEVKQNKQKSIEDTAYRYVDKYYKGQLVLTLKDLEYFTKVSSTTYSYYIRKWRDKFIEGIDYWHLNGAELRKFKAGNSMSNNIAKELIIVNKNGFDKLCRLTGVPLIECFNKDSLDDVINPNFKSDKNIKLVFSEAREEIEALKVLLNGFDSYNKIGIYKTYQDMMLEIVRSLFQKIYILSKIDVMDKDIRLFSFKKNTKEWQDKHWNDFKINKGERYAEDEPLVINGKHEDTHFFYLL